MTQCHNRVMAYSHNHNLVTDFKEGFDYILTLLSQPLWLRTISTKATDGRQVLVDSKEQALAYFKAAKYFDCRISAYPYWRPSLVSEFIGIKNPIPPDLIMVDLDLCNFQLDYSALETALQKAILKIKRLLSLTPTVIWSGNGYHIYIPTNAVVLENVREFAHVEHISTKFLRFAEWYLSSGLSDSSHNRTVSLNNCMLRIPGSVNSRINAQVRIINKWDGNRPNINLLIGTFCAYLKEQQLKEQNAIVKRTPSINSADRIKWIDRLLQTPITDHRKFAVWMILPQYLMNVRKLSYDQANNIVNKWLDECNKLKRLDLSGVNQKRKEGFRAAENGLLPIGHEKLKNWKPELYNQFHIQKSAG
jgi:hypothetical protein